LSAAARWIASQRLWASSHHERSTFVDAEGYDEPAPTLRFYDLAD